MAYQCKFQCNDTVCSRFDLIDDLGLVDALKKRLKINDNLTIIMYFFVGMYIYKKWYFVNHLFYSCAFFLILQTAVQNTKNHEMSCHSALLHP